MFTYVLLRILHVASVAVWFGAIIGLPGSLKRGLDLGPEPFRYATREAARRSWLALLFGGLSLITGLLIIFDMGGFGSVHRNVHMAIGVVLIMIIVLAAGMHPSTIRLRALGETGAEPDLARAPITRVAITSGVVQLLWLAALFLMIDR